METLAVELVLRRTQHAGKLDVGKIVQRPPNELIVPAGLTLKVKDARNSGLHVNQPAQQVISCVLFAGQRLNSDVQGLRSRLPAVKDEGLALNLSVTFQRDLLGGQDFALVPHAQARFAARKPIALEADPGTQFGLRQSASGYHCMDDLTILRREQAAETHRQ